MAILDSKSYNYNYKIAPPMLYTLYYYSEVLNIKGVLTYFKGPNNLWNKVE